MTEPLLTPAEAAPLLGGKTTAATVRILCAGRQIRHMVTFGPRGQARYRIPESAIDEYIRAHTIQRGRR